jgi:tryptophanyl-tRNA synthetase
MTATFKPQVFSGVQPTGNLHLGNYLGAIRKFVALQNEHDCIFCVVDLHSITAQLVHEDLKAQTRSIAAAFIASGIDPAKHIVFNQSAVSGHAELAWIFNCVASIGWMNRMTQFKDKAGKDRENASLGLLAYPSLMAADILLYRATHVPVGDDQKQHLELTRDIAQKVQYRFFRSHQRGGSWRRHDGGRRKGFRLFPDDRAVDRRSCAASDEPARRIQGKCRNPNPRISLASI